jgi:hypothetical protein
LPTDKDASANQFSERCDRIVEACAITSSIARPRWPDAAQLPKWQIAAQNRESRACKGFRHSDKQG